MTKVSLNLFRNLINSLVDERSDGINKNSYDILIELMKEDRILSMEVHDIVTKLAPVNGNYKLINEEGYEL
jgi:hypothetical protein